MHLKNFSLVKSPSLGYHLSPAYDLVATVLVNPDDKEDLALTLNGKKRKINAKDFVAAFQSSGLDKKQQENIFKTMKKASDEWLEFIDTGFIDREMKKVFKGLIKERLSRATSV
jgi:serine/threonine-protein kinase HipA